MKKERQDPAGRPYSALMALIIRAKRKACQRFRREKPPGSPDFSNCAKTAVSPEALFVHFCTADKCILRAHSGA